MAISLDGIMWRLFVALLLIPFASPESIPLTPESLDQLAGKTVWIKFYAPWCGHCQKLDPIWRQVGNEWKNHPQGVIGEIDCTTGPEIERWCSREMGILGFPTLLYGDPSHGGAFLVEYNGDKDYESLSSFANETLSRPFCSPGNLEPCDATVRQQLESFWEMSADGLQREIDAREGKIAEANKWFKENFDRMQAEYDEYARNHELHTAEIKRNLKMLESVKAMLQ